MAINNSPQIIEIEGIGKAYPKGRSDFSWALRDINLKIGEGKILGLLGPNGSGKTTLIKILSGLLRPDEGRGTVLGYDLLKHPAAVRARVSLVATTAEVGTDNNLTVRQNLAFWAPVYGLNGKAARLRIDELLERLDLTEKAGAWPMHISAGQRQRLALARSLLAHNPLIFLDEPTNKLDQEGVRSVRSLISEMNRNEGTTVILTSHVMEEAEELCGEIALLNRGHLVAHRPTRDLIQSLNLTRPIEVVLQGSRSSESGILNGLEDLPGVSRADLPLTEELVEASGQTISFKLESADLRATTPALLAWVREQGLSLQSLKADPVTLQEVFLAFGNRPGMEKS